MSHQARLLNSNLPLAEDDEHTLDLSTHCLVSRLTFRGETRTSSTASIQGWGLALCLQTEHVNDIPSFSPIPAELSRFPSVTYTIYPIAPKLVSLKHRKVMPKSFSVPTNEEVHAVQFYTDDEFLLKGLCEFVRTALSERQSVILVMTAAHEQELRKHLRAARISVRAAAKQGRFVTLDAGETLATFMHGDTPVPTKFFSQIGNLISRASMAASDRNIPVAIFGEMVAVLWSQRRFTAAIELEQLWNELAKAHRFYLRCAYPANGFSGDMKVPYAMICAQHSHVFSADSASESLSHFGDETPNYSRAA